TAKKYLELLAMQGLVQREFMLHKPGKPTRYTLRTEEIIISLDLAYMAKSLQLDLPIDNPMIRERANLEPDVKYQLTEGGLVNALIIRKRTKARRYVSRTIELSEMEQRFYQHVPHPTMAYEFFLKICHKVGISDYFDLKQLLVFVQKLQRLNIVNFILEIEKKER
ncbi:unnamed protein product, partial [marine sediment metagenome]